MFRRPLLLTVALALVTGVAGLAVVFPQVRDVPGAPIPYCTVLRVLFDTDEEMRSAAAVLREDDRVREVRDERTKAENHERLTQELRQAGRDDLADAAAVDHTPASLRVVEAFGVDAGVFADELRLRHRVNHIDACENPEVLQDGG
ncbi:hypothetical protein [Saccharothrix sp. NRRL B-16314]|uniref:hypothetical protein n=1 Tax=Saccharothrix sp. NRRL B-16314 TaxID=1463825 RepID=UPI00052701C5|nr:hypothetical protein [Saccharothrix sp. NRRL B-16314]